MLPSLLLNREWLYANLTPIPQIHIWSYDTNIQTQHKPFGFSLHPFLLLHILGPLDELEMLVPLCWQHQDPHQDPLLSSPAAVISALCELRKGERLSWEAMGHLSAKLIQNLWRGHYEHEKPEKGTSDAERVRKDHTIGKKIEYKHNPYQNA